MITHVCSLSDVSPDGGRVGQGGSYETEGIPKEEQSHQHDGEGEHFLCTGVSGDLPVPSGGHGGGCPVQGHQIVTKYARVRGNPLHIRPATGTAPVGGNRCALKVQS